VGAGARARRGGRGRALIAAPGDEAGAQPGEGTPQPSPGSVTTSRRLRGEFG